MSMAALRNTDVIGGLLTLGLAVGVLVESSQYGRGTILRMGPGYFPTLLGILLLALGAALTVRGLQGHGEPIAAPLLRPIIFISGALGLFALALPRFGLAPAIGLLVLVSAGASSARRPMTITLLAIGLTVFAYVVFVKLLSLHVELLRW
ncbi:MAG TPA: tripartite tricarboxylate transporter TctB family protein [Xanthobacteraceae bacterium]